MDLNRLQVETLLNVSSQDLDAFITEKNLPCYFMGEENRFDLLEIESWMLQHKFWDGHSQNLPYNLYRALARGGYYHLNDLEDAAILKLGAFQLSQKLGIDQDVLFSLLQDRESLASTAIGNGYAVPHTRERLEVVKHDMIFVVHLNNPIDFLAIDRKKVHTFFFLMAGSDKSHLNLLSKLAHLICDKTLDSWVNDKTTDETLLKSILEWEQDLTLSKK